MSTDTLVLKTRPSHLSNVFYYIFAVWFIVTFWLFQDNLMPYIVNFCHFVNDHIWQKEDVFVLTLAGISLYALIGSPLLLMGYRFLQTQMNVFYFYENRLVFYHGVFNRHRENIEYYRIKDHVIRQPFYLAIFGLSSMSILSTDRRYPRLDLVGFRHLLDYETKLRSLIEKSKDDGKGREMDMV